MTKPAKPKTPAAAPAGEASAARPERPARPCPTCGRMSVAATWPFCSDRCRKVDLHRWLSGVYAIPAAEDPDDEAG